jgi:transcription initiation factor TFIID subunit 7
MLIVYEDEYAMEEAELAADQAADRGTGESSSSSSSSSSGYPAYYHSGLTPPLRKVIQRRYLARYEERDTKPIPPAKKDVAAVEKEIQALISKLKLNSTKSKQSKKGSSSVSSSIKTDKRIIEEVEEEIVDYESWMGSGGILYTTDEIIKLYPECWLTKSELQAIDSQNRAVQDEQRKRKEETARLAQQKLETEQAKLQAKAEKKAKKKQEKMKNKRLSSDGGTVDKGNAVAGGGIIATTSSIADEIDEVTAAAMTITAGGDEDFLFDGMGDGDDMFDFDNEDITDLLG